MDPTPPPACPTCSGELHEQDEGVFACREDHRYTIIGLALTTNIDALRALWLAIRALENDAAGLELMAAKYGDRLGLPAEARRREAVAALDAAGLLRGHARRAQERLDALPVAPPTVVANGRQAGRGG